MLAIRIIPALLHRGHELVKGKNFNPWRSVGHVAQALETYQTRAVDEVILLDVTASVYGKPPGFEFLATLTTKLFSPLTVGGGIRKLEDVQRLLEIGADKISIGTGLADATLLPVCAKAFGCQAIVASIDVCQGLVVRRCGSEPTKIKATEWAKRCEVDGAGEILLTSIDREGTMEGYDLALIGSIARRVSIPVIAHGGCQDYEDMKNAIDAGASAVAAGALYQFTEMTPKGAAEYLHKQGIEVRLEPETTERLQA